MNRKKKQEEKMKKMQKKHKKTPATGSLQKSLLSVPFFIAHSASGQCFPHRPYGEPYWFP